MYDNNNNKNKEKTKESLEARDLTKNLIQKNIMVN